MKYLVTIAGEERTVEVRRGTGATYLVSMDGAEAREVAAEQLSAAEWAVAEDGARATIRCALRGDHLVTQVSGRSWSGAVVDPRSLDIAGGAAKGQGAVVTPMPGVVVRIEVVVGQDVAPGDVLCVVEAMKMENEYRSEVAGVVAEIHVTEGQAVEAQTRLITVRPTEA